VTLSCSRKQERMLLFCPNQVDVDGRAGNCRWNIMELEMGEVVDDMALSSSWRWERLLLCDMVMYSS
jgi:hypothetical protein